MPIANSMPVQYLWLIPLGFLVGAFGTIIGAGGGFILAPVLLLVFPKESPEIIASISLAVVFLNAFSGSIAYARMGRIHYRSGLFFAAASVPGAILGAILLGYLPRAVYSPALGVLLTTMACYLLLRPHGPELTPEHGGPARGSSPIVPPYNRALGGGVSFVIGGISSMLGIGGGIIHVPFMTRVLRFPTHVATATSHFVLAVMALAGTIVHICTGEFHRGVYRTALLGCGVLVGAQVGAIISGRIHGTWIIRGLAIALAAVGIRVLLS